MLKEAGHVKYHRTLAHLRCAKSDRITSTASIARRMVSGDCRLRLATPNDLDHDFFGCINPAPCAPAIRVGSTSRSLAHTFTGDICVRRHSAGVRTLGKAVEARVRLRFAGRYFYRYVAAAGRISGGCNRGLDAGRRRGAGTVRAAKCVFGVGRARQTYAFRGASQTRRGDCRYRAGRCSDR